VRVVVTRKPGGCGLIVRPGTYTLGEGCGIQEVLLVELNDCWEVCERLVSDEVEPSTSRDDVMAHFVVLTACREEEGREGGREGGGRKGRREGGREAVTHITL